ncbi:MAG: CAP domain-containing protein, partial [Kofleriaceae bacterium]
LKANNCGFDHSNGKYGENLAAATIGALTPESVVTMWYDELKGYSFKQPGFSMQTGHFTQVVWRGTKQVGCGSAQCNGLEIWVCEYDPPGNWHGQYREHVLPLGCE